MHTCMDGRTDELVGGWIDCLLACWLARSLACLFSWLFAGFYDKALVGSIKDRVTTFDIKRKNVDSNVLTWHILSHYKAPTSLACFWEKTLRNLPNLSSQMEAHPWVARWI